MKRGTQTAAEWAGEKVEQKRASTGALGMEARRRASWKKHVRGVQHEQKLIFSVLCAYFHLVLSQVFRLLLMPVRNGPLKPQDGQNDSNNGLKQRGIIKVRFRHIKTS